MVVKSEERKAEEAIEGSSKDESKRVTEKEGGADLKVFCNHSCLS